MLDDTKDKPPGDLAHGGLYDALLEEFTELPKRKKLDEDNFGVVNVSPPVVPNPYLPSFRVFSYNITGPETPRRRDSSIAGKERLPHHGGGSNGGRFKKCKEKEHRDTWRCRLNQPWNSDPTAPSRANQLWTPLGYAQVRGAYSVRKRGSHFVD